MTESPDEIEDVKRERIVNQHRDVAVIGLRNRQGQVLLVRTSRFPSRWQPVGGGVAESDASLVDALIREVNEEVGLSVGPSELTHVIEAPYDFGTGTVHFFELSHFVDPAEIHIDEEAILEHRWCDIKSALELPMFPATAAYLRGMAETLE